MDTRVCRGVHGLTGLTPSPDISCADDSCAPHRQPRAQSEKRALVLSDTLEHTQHSAVVVVAEVVGSRGPPLNTQDFDLVGEVDRKVRGKGGVWPR